MAIGAASVVAVAPTQSHAAPTPAATSACAQWAYQDSPFQWVALQEPDHVTGMMCDGAAGSIHYALVDSVQNPDGSWHVITRTLGHNFTNATIDFLPEQDVPDAPDFADQYGNIFNCTHPALTSTPTASGHAMGRPSNGYRCSGRAT